MAGEAAEEGKARTRARTSWTLEAGPHRYRCLYRGPDSYELQTRNEKGKWIKVGDGANPLGLMNALTTSKTIAHILTGWTDGATA